MKFFFALLGVALAAHSSWPQDHLLKSQTEYRFSYEGFVSSGISLPNSEKAITRHRSDVILQVHDERHIVLQLENVQLSADNVTPESEKDSFERVQKMELSREHKELLETPVRFQIRQGQITELQFAPNEPNWSANLKRSIISMLQLNWQELSNQKEEFSQGKFFTINEKTVEGDCEVAYNVIPEPGKTTVTKTINFDKCEGRMLQVYSQHFETECVECKTKKIQPWTVYTYKMESGELKEIELTSTYSVNLEKQPLMKSKVQARLVLKETSGIRNRIETHNGKTEELVYNKEFDAAMEQFFKKGDEVKINELASIHNKVSLFEQAVKKLSNEQVGTIESTEILMKMVYYLRLCTEKELHEIQTEVYKKSEKNIQAFIENALAIAGTKNTVKHILRLATHHPVPKVVSLLKSIQQTPFASEEIAEQVMEFAKSERAERHPAIKQTAMLAYGVLTRAAIGSPLDKYAIKPTKHFQNKVVEFFNQEWEKADSIYEMVLVLKSIANAGLEGNVALLERIIMDKKQPTIVRIEAIDALRLHSEQMPRKIQKILLPVFSSRLEKNEIRMAALRMIVQAKPALPELSQIVNRMEREPNQNVAAYTYKVLSSLAESKLPCHRNISSMTNTLLRASQYRPETRFLSQYQQLSVFNWETLSGLSMNLQGLVGKDSFIPTEMAASIETVFGGNWNKYLVEFGISQQNVEALYNKILSKLDKQGSSRATRFSKTLKELGRKLNIQLRESTTEESFAMIYLRYKQMDYAVLPVDEKIIDEVIEMALSRGSFDLQKVLRLLQVDPEFEINAAGFVFDSLIKLPNSFGLPMILYNRMPITLGVNGKLTIEDSRRGVSIRLQAQPKIGAMNFHYLQHWTPYFTNGVKFVRSADVQIPIDVTVEIPSDETRDIKIIQKMLTEEKTLLRVQATPICFVRYFKHMDTDRFAGYNQMTITAPKMERLTEEMRHRIESNGVEFVLSGLNYRQWNLESVLLGEHHIELKALPTSRTPKEVVMTISFKNERGQMESPKVEKMLRREMETEKGEWESRSDRREHLNKAVRELELSNAYLPRVQIQIESVERTEIELRAECEKSFRFIRASVEVKPEQRHRDWSLKSEVEIVLPKAVSTVEELKEQKHREVQILCETKWGSEKVEIVAQLEQSKHQRNLVQQPKQLRGVPAQELLSRLARLNQLKAHINYELSPRSEKFVQEYFGLLKAYNFWSSQIESAENERNRVVLQLTSEPMVPGFYNLTIETPKSSFRIEEIQSFDIVPTIVRQPKNFLRHTSIEKSECKIEQSRIRTFEDSFIRAPLSTCYTVAVKDCSSEPRFAVLVKNVEKKSDEKMVKIIYENDEYELEFPQGELKVTLNGKKIRESELEENKIEKIGDLCVVDLGELVVRFDGYTVKVLLDNAEMESQCGLCGNSVEQKEMKYRNARNEDTDDLEEFHKSFMVRDECREELSEKRIYKEYSNEEASYETYDDEERWSKKSSRKSNNKKEYNEYDNEETEPKEQYLVKEESHRICFSTERIRQCPKSMTPSKSSDKKVKFGCLPRHNSEARRMTAAIRRGDDIDTSLLKTSFTETISVPKACIAF